VATENYLVGKLSAGTSLFEGIAHIMRRIIKVVFYVTIASTLEAAIA